VIQSVVGALTGLDAQIAALGDSLAGLSGSVDGVSGMLDAQATALLGVADAANAASEAMGRLDVANLDASASAGASAGGYGGGAYGLMTNPYVMAAAVAAGGTAYALNRAIDIQTTFHTLGNQAGMSAALLLLIVNRVIVPPVGKCVVGVDFKFVVTRDRRVGNAASSVTAECRAARGHVFSTVVAE
jgi:uncharacterized membrane protein